MAQIMQTVNLERCLKHCNRTTIAQRARTLRDRGGPFFPAPRSFMPHCAFVHATPRG